MNKPKLAAGWREYHDTQGGRLGAVLELGSTEYGEVTAPRFHGEYWHGYATDLGGEAFPTLEEAKQYVENSLREELVRYCALFGITP